MFTLQRFIFLTSFLGMVGCGRAEPTSVVGTLTLDGLPLPGARVSFVPVEKDKAGLFAMSDPTAADGHFEVPGGLRPGEFKAVIVMDPSSVGGPPGLRIPPEEMRIKFEEVEARAKKVPAVYKSPETTPLKISAPVDDPFNIELSSNP